ncbi:hypothetical protein ABID08_002344 [Rhizobium binae]|uniref:Uncharacterized protein n=1 Tax=Rhizobium binae TaxID=1138190 RepID=A0ABV2MEV2_9HYPH|nr:hypothetical protein [Rhizobium binae]MBX4993160.1 hypothetical protein [Rhizobium binae]NKL47463.1 hypothetical protein [Rhizobium leguminosarum bv. viciae]QSY83918.1 hypothetical protein J2J99_09045 [Rhizobium binae]
MAPFKYQSRAREFNEAYTKQVADDLERVREGMIAPRNMQRFSHGQRWRTKPVVLGDETGELTVHSFGIESPFEDIVSHDLVRFVLARRKLASGLSDELARTLYQAISQSTERSGNIATATPDQAPVESYLDAMEKIEFAIEESGEVSLPTTYMDPQRWAEIVAQLNDPSSEHHARWERIKAEKSLRARQRESERLAKFPAAWAEEYICE